VDSIAPPLSIETLRSEVDAGAIDTVVVGIVDMQGRLQGKRFHARHFVDEVGAPTCSRSTWR
jgi:glutamine synthetase